MRFLSYLKYYNQNNNNGIKNFSFKLNDYQKVFVNTFFISLLILISFVLINEIISPINKNFKYSKEIYSQNGEMIAAFLSQDEKWRFQTSIEEISPYLIKTIIFKEDKYFYYHLGVNPISIVKAFSQNILNNEITSGASTISMQLIRMIEKRDRTYINKLIEIIRASYLELKFNKREILEMYLSLLPYGGNIEGVKSASYLFFEKSPSKLSLSEATLLSIIPNNPNYLRLDKESNIDRLRNTRNKILYTLNSNNIFDKSDISDALNENLISKRESIENIIPHLSLRFRNSLDNKIFTFIDIKTQKKVSDLLKAHNQKLKYMDISNCATLVIENKSGKVISYCGSADFNDSLSEGQNDGIKAIRSPGSTLKPALFALAMDEGILNPKRILYDIPSDFKGYEPENYDSKFNGAITSEFALYNSLNIPAVNLLNNVGVSKFISLLKNVGFRDIAKKEKKLGLSMILGACGSNAIELGELYTAFTNNGYCKKIIFSQNELMTNTENKKIFSPEAVYLISNMIKFKEDRILEMKQKRIPNISWKTGTSYGKRDAWAVGYDANYTIVVWCGNFNGKGSPFLIGGEIALPLLFEIYEKIGVKEINHQLPKNLILSKVCKKSGKLPNDYCDYSGNEENLTDDYLIKNVTLPEKCDLHQLRYISLDSTIYYCNSCLPRDNKYIKEVFINYPPEYKLWLSINNKYYRDIIHNPKCQSINYSGKLKILSPNENFVYYVEKNSGQEINLKAASDDLNEMLYWYVNNEFVGKCKAYENIYFTPIQDNYLIKCISKRGKSEEISIKIVFY